jgi:CRP/FNR family cyclic AMP-dependent transcriptional regulator
MKPRGAKALGDFPLLRELPVEVRAELERKARMRIVQKNRILFLPGDPSDSVYFLASGRVKISRLSETGKELILEILEGGRFFGEAGVLDGLPRETAAEALESTSLWVVSADRFRDVAARTPALALDLARVLGHRQRQLERRLLDVVYKNAPQRLADLLLQLSESYGVRDARGILLRIKLSQSALGNLLGVSREIVNHTFSELKRRGVIDLADGRVVIHDPKALAQLAA